MPKLRARAVPSVSIQSLENRRLLSGSLVNAPQIDVEPIVIGVPGLSAVTFTASSGRRTTLSARNVTAAIDFSGPAVPIIYKGSAVFPTGVVETINTIALTNAVANKASLTEIGSYGPGLFDIGSITGGNLSAIVAPDSNLTGTINVSSIKRLTLGDVSGGAINLGNSAATVNVRGVMTGALTSTALSSLTAYELVQANIYTTGAFSKSKLQIGSINGGQGIEQSNIISAGNIGSVTAAFIEKSVITAAAHPPATAAGTYPTADVPEYSTAFVQPAFIGSIKVKSGGFFSASVIAAETIKSAQLAQLGAGGGIAAHKFGAVVVVAPTGSLNRVSLHLGPAQLKTSTTLRKALTSDGVPYQVGAGLPDNTLFFNLNLNVLR